MKTTLVDAMKRLDSLDFRVKGRTKHLASEIAIITLCSIVSGGTSYYDFAAFGHERLRWLRKFLVLKNGIPSHDTFKRFWEKLPPAAFNACFMAWLDSFLELEDGDGIHIDGKCLRRAIAQSGKIPCIVSAYSSKERIVIGQVKTARASRVVLEYSVSSGQHPVLRAPTLDTECWLLDTYALRPKAALMPTT